MMRRSLIMLLGTALAACQPDVHTSAGVAQRFVDAHYVQIDLAAAREYCSGVALQKLTKEQELTQGQSIDESTRKPSVHYRLIEKHEDNDEASYVFEGTITVADAGQFTRKWLIATRHAAGRWTVSNFEEFD